MIFQIIGSAIVIFSTVFAGFYYGNLETYRTQDLLEMKKALAILKSEIEFAHTPLPEALENIAKRTKSPINGIFIQLKELLLEGKGHGIGALWEEALQRNNSRSYFAKEDMDQFFSFGKTLGYLDKGMQLGNIQILTGYIDDKTVSLNESRLKNKKMFQSLGVLSGVLIVIVML